jgi:hypothetical protein
VMPELIRRDWPEIAAVVAIAIVADRLIRR